MIDKLLPYGTVVTLKGATRKLIIIGVFQKAEADGKIYDYCACAYPVGYLNSDDIFLFNQDKIEKINFMGYTDEEVEDYLDDVLWEMNKNREEDKNG